MTTLSKLLPESQRKISFGGKPESGDHIAHESLSVAERMANLGKGFLKKIGGHSLKAAGPLSLVLEPVALSKDYLESSRLFEGAISELKLKLPDGAKGDFQEVFIKSKFMQRRAEAGAELNEHYGLADFIEWGKKYKVPLGAMTKLNPTTAKPELIEHLMNNSQTMATNAPPRSNIHLAQAQAQQVARPEGVTATLSSEMVAQNVTRTYNLDIETTRLG